MCVCSFAFQASKYFSLTYRTWWQERELKQARSRFLGRNHREGHRDPRGLDLWTFTKSLNEVLCLKWWMFLKYQRSETYSSLCWRVLIIIVLFCLPFIPFDKKGPRKYCFYFTVFKTFCWGNEKEVLHEWVAHAVFWAPVLRNHTYIDASDLGSLEWTHRDTVGSQSFSLLTKTIAVISSLLSWVSFRLSRTIVSEWISCEKFKCATENQLSFLSNIEVSPPL